MADEKELKFLLADDSWKQHIAGVMQIEQGFLTPANYEGPITRVRLIDQQKAVLTIKGPIVIDTDGLPTKFEYEDDMPFEEASLLIGMCPNRIRKTRHLVDIQGYLWEIDVFHDYLDGLVLAELEKRPRQVLPFPPVTLPAFVGRNVSLDMRYTNFSLVYHGLPPDYTKRAA